MEQIILIKAMAMTLFGCTDRGPEVSQGECITPVDGMQIYKVSRIEGKSIYAHTAGGAEALADHVEIMIPETMPRLIRI